MAKPKARTAVPQYIHKTVRSNNSKGTEKEQGKDGRNLPVGDVPVEGALETLEDLQQVHHHRSSIWAESMVYLT